MSLVSKIIENRAEKVETGWGRYRELLESDSDSPAAVRELEQLMAILGRTADDAVADQTVLRQARRKVQEIEINEKNLPEIESLHKKINEHNEKTQEIVKLRRAEVSVIVHRLDALENFQATVGSHQMNIIEMRRKHGKLLGEIGADIAASSGLMND